MIRDTGWGTDFVKPLLNPLIEESKVDETSSPLRIRSSQQGRPYKAFADKSLEVAFRKSAMLSRTFECGPSWLVLLLLVQLTFSAKGIALHQLL